MKRLLSGIYTFWYFLWNVLVPVALFSSLLIGAIYFLVIGNLFAAVVLGLLLVAVDLVVEAFSAKK